MSQTGYPSLAMDASEPQRTMVVAQSGFRITTQKLPISKAGQIDEMTRRLNIAVPEMIFGDNYVSVEHASSGLFINFNAFDALDRVDKTGAAMLQVAHSGEWQKSREHHHEGIKEVVKPFDWSYSTNYRGSVVHPTAQFRSDTTEIPFELLRRPDPILFFDDVILYEDELADNGIAALSCKIRVMPARLLLLSRFFLRLDNVMFRIRDTRIYIDLETKSMIREYTAREAEFEVVRKLLLQKKEDFPSMIRDANRLVDLLPVVEKSLESMTL